MLVIRKGVGGNVVCFCCGEILEDCLFFCVSKRKIWQARVQRLHVLVKEASFIEHNTIKFSTSDLK
jgi:hypothetical protein